MTPPKRLRSIFVGLVLATLPAPALTAQGTAAADSHERDAPLGSVPAARVDTLAVRHVVLADAIAGTRPVANAYGALLDPFDLRIAASIRGSSLRENGPVRAAADVFRLAGIPGTILLAGGLYTVGEVTDHDDVRDIGLQTGQAIVVAGGATLAGKVLFGRARPHTSPANPYDVRFGRGLEGDRYQSFPSAHTAAAFATAAVMATELGERHRESRIWIYPSAFTAATLAGLSRLFHDEHWATDVVAGALIGTLSGWLVTDYHDRPAE